MAGATGGKISGICFFVRWFGETFFRQAHAATLTTSAQVHEHHEHTVLAHPVDRVYNTEAYHKDMVAGYNGRRRLTDSCISQEVLPPIRGKE